MRLTAAELTEKAVYGLPELNGDRIAGADAGGESGLLCDVGDSGAGAAAEGRSGGSRARNYFRFEVGRVGSGQGADRQDAFCFGGRQSCRRIRFSITGTWARSSSNLRLGGAGIDLYAASAADSARDSVDDLCASEPGDDSAGSGIVLSRIFMRASAGCGCFRRRSFRRCSFRCIRIIAIWDFVWRKTDGGWC